MDIANGEYHCLALVASVGSFGVVMRLSLTDDAKAPSSTSASIVDKCPGGEFVCKRQPVLKRPHEAISQLYED